MKKRRQIYMVLAVCLMVIVVGFLAMARDIAARPVSYGVDRIAPLEAVLCPGDTLTYPVSVSVIGVPGVVTIAETWCRTGTDGVCSMSLAKSYTIPLMDYRKIDSIARREIPHSAFFVQGEEYEFWHGAEGDGGYIVGPFEIGAACGGGGSGGN